MGHTPNANNMASRYRQRIDDERLEATVKPLETELYPVCNTPLMQRDPSVDLR